jgi:SagB-type dehydrogenase family enzyme
MKKGVGDKFQEETKYYFNSIGGRDFELIKQPELYKTYPNNKKIILEKPIISPKLTFDEILKKRKSIRTFSNESLESQDLSFLLWASTGIQRKEFGSDFRTAPSAGALYPIETYLVINRVKNIYPGVYHYSVRNHFLEELKTGYFGIKISEAALGQIMCADCSVVFIWTAIFNRSRWKYNQRCYRYIYLDAGHIAENLALAATSINLGSCQIGALFDDEVNKIIGVDGIYESTIYMSVIGNIIKQL